MHTYREDDFKQALADAERQANKMHDIAEEAREQERRRQQVLSLFICMYVCMYVCMFIRSAWAREEKAAGVVFIYMHVCVCVCMYVYKKRVSKRGEGSRCCLLYVYTFTCDHAIYWVCMYVVCVHVIYWVCMYVICVHVIYWVCMYVVCVHVIYWVCMYVSQGLVDAFDKLMHSCGVWNVTGLVDRLDVCLCLCM
jgi:hypothetical protein